MSDFPEVFAGWMPDLPAYDNPGEQQAKNVLPASLGYKPIRSLTAGTTTGLGGACLGAYAAVDKNSNIQLYAGDTTALYRVTSSSATDYSKSGGYTVAASDHWEFAQFNQDVLATNYTDDVQAITMGATAFADLGGSPPKARHIGVWGDFVVLGNLNDSVDGILPQRLQWSGFDNAAQWTVGTNQSDYQDLKGNGGDIQAIVGGDINLLFQERALWRATYQGTPRIFSIDLVENARGTAAPASVASVGLRTMYLADDGFYATDGTQSVPIGANRVDKTILQSLSDAQLSEVRSAVDAINKFVIWSYRVDSEGYNDRMVVYDYVNDKWAGPIHVDTELIFTGLGLGATLDELDSLYANLDAIPVSLDSRIFIGGAPVLGAFNTDHKYATFSGSLMTPEVITGERQLNLGGTALIAGVRPFSDGVPTISIGTRPTQQTAISYASAVSLDTLGMARPRSDSRFHSIKVSNTGTWTEMRGLDVEFVPTGRR